jgi:hypothetical protein
MASANPARSKWSKRLVIAIPALVAFLLLGFAYYLPRSPGWRFAGAYRQLRLGMSQDDVRKLFGPEIEFACRYKSSDIWYYRAPNLPFFDLAGDFKNSNIERGATVPTLNDLPNVYDHVQLAFDAGGRLHAYTWIGETYTVESTNRSVPGSHFKELSPSDF